MTFGKHNKEKGAAVIEFVILMIFIALPLVFGIIDFGFIWAQKQYMTEAVHEGARVGAQIAQVTCDPATGACTLDNLAGADGVAATVADAIDRHLDGLPLFGGKLADEINGSNPPTITLVMVPDATAPIPTLSVSASVTIANLWVPILWDLLQIVAPGSPGAPGTVGSTAVFPIPR